MNWKHDVSKAWRGSREIEGVKITAVRGKDEFVVGVLMFDPTVGYPKISKVYDLVIEPIISHREIKG